MKTSNTTAGVNYKFSMTAPKYNVKKTSTYIMVHASGGSDTQRY